VARWEIAGFNVPESVPFTLRNLSAGRIGRTDHPVRPRADAGSEHGEAARGRMTTATSLPHSAGCITDRAPFEDGAHVVGTGRGGAAYVTPRPWGSHMKKWPDIGNRPLSEARATGITSHQMLIDM
jgi:hypothetical protein